MTWHLKDRELEKKLIELCPSFLSALDLAVYLSNDDEDHILVEVTRKKYDIELADDVFYFWTDELEDVPEYNPHAWNEYPKVTPPEGVLMRIECYDGTCGAGAFVNGEWHEDGTDELPNVTRFRPWED